MKSSELRIGNWVEKFTDLGDSLGYSSVLPKEFLAIHTKPERIKPIPLTEEILLKCGFENDVKNLYSLIKNDEFYIKYNVHNNGFYLCINGFYIIRVNNLHQLQNLYFALTREELEINL